MWLRAAVLICVRRAQYCLVGRDSISKYRNIIRFYIQKRYLWQQSEAELSEVFYILVLHTNLGCQVNMEKKEILKIVSEQVIDDIA